ncbi:unnamed protein product [Didymodactylos carnosus]|uniref:Adenylyltransferase and sulfurtransferase MOCS3 homolog n=1 Tax=Didymodactylos carnosus TaxID=1234261 RepID=A0A813PUB7_9BILA|nr:unnamed protein product [Didymodactylos carnosus]CAF0815727.1 unnamed protein product [Didymodactylos carnosus]CAF3533671.1 unnamed protein product [Didymodactylos carnosus]CAF3599831.1 unnamed protein product [Didymodactylos carnosus]
MAFIKCIRDHSLNDEDVSRYSRQLILSEFGVESQDRLKQSSALIVGCGGLGSPCALYLTACGLGRLGLLDHDSIDITNLHRQIIHNEQTLNQPKVESAALNCRKLNSTIKIDVYNELLTSENAMKIFNDYDVIVDCTDNVLTRYLINDCSILLNKPLISASAIRFEGQLTVFNYKNGPCFRCLYPVPPPELATSNCSDVGVLGPVCGTLGSLQALETIKVLTNIGDVLSNRMLLFDGLAMTFRVIKLRQKQSTCAVCSENPIIQSLQNYDLFCQRTVSNDNPVEQKILNSDERLRADEYIKWLSDDEKVKQHCLIDVRPTHELAIGRLPNTINLPIDTIIGGGDSSMIVKTLTDLIEKHQLKNIVVICRRGNDSQIAVRKFYELLKDYNEKNSLTIGIKDIIGGFYAWHKYVDHTFPIY